ncbi:hypothetical protein [Dysgonomonas sp. 25]|uniref:hypothetical protein n=1 Tax=Dysgonomonas sp. 25 TaxID=2302933 RepID=UPI0013D08BA5|nr:hypothetical protein [Dysgonomonas sp. 25]NDV68579.1 hypothetical protein [Dysgonomonas sp. 25]
MRRFLRNVLITALLLVLLWFFASCRSTKKERAEQKYTGSTQQNSNIEATQEQELRAEIEKIVNKALSEQMNVNYKETEYDTDKPVNTLTGKPPVKKEKETFFQKKTDKNAQMTEQAKVNQQGWEKTNDKSKSISKINSTNSTKSETNTQKESDIFLKWIGGLTLFLVISGLFLYILRKYLKKKLHDFL